jgi:hypothetical protein
MSKEDIINIEILADGQIKSTFDPISPANHSVAEAFTRLLDELTGTKGKRTRRKDAKVHVHTHTHENEGGGHKH